MSTNAIRVVPTRTEGLPEVTEVIFYHDRVTACSAGQWVVMPFAPVARWPRPVWLRKALAWVGYPPPWRLIADRDWVATATESLFVFYYTPTFKL
jgi:beta-glucosidase/6-phospho-beta-glucosidase/beta-galactosidase